MYRPPRKMREEICVTCKGSGRRFGGTAFDWGPKPCESCGGKGKIQVPIMPPNIANRPRGF